jgi:hypothetical protein
MTEPFFFNVFDRESKSTENPEATNSDTIPADYFQLNFVKENPRIFQNEDYEKMKEEHKRIKEENKLKVVANKNTTVAVNDKKRRRMIQTKLGNKKFNIEDEEDDSEKESKKRSAKKQKHNYNDDLEVNYYANFTGPRNIYNKTPYILADTNYAQLWSNIQSNISRHQSYDINNVQSNINLILCECGNDYS